MTIRLDVRPYSRPFRQPLHTAHGHWPQREGLILRFENERGQVTFGEIAPIPWFGSETLEQAQAFCDRFPRHFATEQINDIPDFLSACQFGFSAIGPHPPSPFSQNWEKGSRKAWSFPSLALWERNWPFDDVGKNPCDICALLPTGAAALERWEGLWQAGHRTFKWKIGVMAVEAELPIFQQLVEALPPKAYLRLDANGGLTPDAAKKWLAACDRTPLSIEFLEQPLSPDRILDWLPQVKGQFQTAIALDESVATFQQLQEVYGQVGAQVIYVVKPAIAGWPHRLLDFCLHHQLDVVVSSALETPVGQNQAIQLAQTLWSQGTPKRALGFGVGHWFADDWASLSEEAVWNLL